MSSRRDERRRRTRVWLTVLTVALVAIAAACVLTSQWSVALTTLGAAAVFALLTRAAWRRR